MRTKCKMPKMWWFVSASVYSHSALLPRTSVRIPWLTMGMFRLEQRLNLNAIPLGWVDNLCPYVAVAAVDVVLVGSVRCCCFFGACFGILIFCCRRNDKRQPRRSEATTTNKHTKRRLIWSANFRHYQFMFNCLTHRKPDTNIYSILCEMSLFSVSFAHSVFFVVGRIRWCLVVFLRLFRLLRCSCACKLHTLTCKSCGTHFERVYHERTHINRATQEQTNEGPRSMGSTPEY